MLASIARLLDVNPHCFSSVASDAFDYPVTSACINLLTKLSERRWFWMTQHFCTHKLLSPCLHITESDTRLEAIEIIANLVPLKRKDCAAMTKNILAQSLTDHCKQYDEAFLYELRQMLNSDLVLTALKIYKNITYNLEEELSRLLENHVDHLMTAATEGITEEAVKLSLQALD